MKLFVGSLPFALTDQELQELFETIGSVVSAKIILDRATGRSRGFGFVEMSDNAEAKKAEEELNGKDILGRTIVVKEAHDRDSSDSRERSFNR